MLRATCGSEFQKWCNIMIKNILVHIPVAITVMLSSNLTVNPI